MTRSILTYLTAILLIIQFSSCSEDAPVVVDTIRGNVFITNQEQLDEFVAQNIKTVNGDLTIAPISENGTVDISDLSVLSNLDSITGTLIIRQTRGLTSLNGFEGIRFLGGSLFIEFNEDLTSLNGINNLTKAVTVQVLANPKLQNIDAISGINNVRTLNISRNTTLPQLTTFNSLNQLSFLVIAGNTQLSSLQGLENLQNCTEILSVLRNDNLTDLSGLNGLTEVALLDIGENTNLTNLTALSGVTSVKALSITKNASLRTLTGLENLESIRQGSIDIWDNPVLESLEGLGEELNFVGQAGFTTRQSASIRIGNNPLLTDLGSIRLRGALFNQLEFWDMPLVTAVPKFEAGTAISDLRVENLDQVVNLAPILAVDGPIHDLTIINNDLLENLDGLTGFNSVSGNFNVGNNEKLHDLCGISDAILQEVYESYLVVRNAYNPTIEDFKAGNCSN